LAPLENLAAPNRTISPKLAQRPSRGRWANLSADETVPPRIEGQDGFALRTPSTTCSAAGMIGLPGRGRVIMPSVSAAYADRTVRRPEQPGAQLHIFGQLEAGLTETDRVILGGLVETVWPPAPRVDRG